MKTTNVLMISMATVLAAGVAQAQRFESTPYFLASDLEENSGAETVVVAVGNVVVADAPWLQVHVGRHHLGKGSYVVFRSLEDGYSLRHNERTLAQWGGWSAFFNGETVEVELHVARGARGVFVEVDEILVGMREGARAPNALDAGGGEGVAGSPCSEDRRVGSGAKRVGRGITNDDDDPRSGCTNWIIANGALLSAGHCWPTLPYVEFDIPDSDCDGTVNFGDPDHQYAYDMSSFDCDTDENCQYDGRGADWSVRGVFPNPNTGRMPAYGEGAFARLARDLDILDPSTVRLTGCGIDDVPEGCTDAFNSDSRTRQTSTGDYSREESNSTGTWIEYDIYGRNALSGAPVFDVAHNVGIGIHTNSTEGGDCPSSGTSFNHNPLEFAINTFPGLNTVYVDQGHPITLETGKIFRPFLTLEGGLAEVPAGGLLSVVEGTYTLSSGIINQPVVIAAPVGPVIITH